MKKVSLSLLVVVITFFSCQKSNDTQSSVKIDYSKLVNKVWYRDGIRDEINSVAAFTTQFKSDSSGYYRYCTWIVQPYRYTTANWTWQMRTNDTITLNGWYKLKIRSVNDTMLVTNGKWTTFGIREGEIDNTDAVFKCFN